MNVLVCVQYNAEWNQQCLLHACFLSIRCSRCRWIQNSEFRIDPFTRAESRL